MIEYEGYGITDFFRNVVNKTTSTISNITAPIVHGFMKLIPASARTFLNWRNGYNNKSQNTLQNFGRFRIKSIYIRKCPVQQVLINVMNVLSFGYFKDLMDKYGYDQLFHLQVIVLLENNQSITIEKNEEIDIYNKANYGESKGCQIIEVQLPVDFAMTLKQFVDNAKRNTGSLQKWFDYDAFRNNCQFFILMLLRYNALMRTVDNSYIKDFIYQPMDQLYNDLNKNTGWLAPLAKAVTRTGAIFNKIIGKGIPKEKVNDELYNVLKLLTFDMNKASIVGSFSNPDLKYYSDIDVLENVEISIKKLSKLFQKKVITIVNDPRISIIDIKLGNIPSLQVIDEFMYFAKSGRLLRYRPKESRLKLQKIYDQKRITKAEYEKGKKLLVDNPNFKEMNKILEHLRFHILRWTPQEIINGVKEHRGIKITLVDALKSPGIFKMDTIFLSNKTSKYEEINILYNLNHSVSINPKRTIISDIYKLYNQKHYMKTIKRIMALLDYKREYENYNETDIINDISPFMNGIVGPINILINDITLLQTLNSQDGDTPYIENIKNAIDEKLNSLLTLKQLEELETEIKDSTKDKLDIILNFLQKMVDDEAKIFLKKTKIFTNF